MSKSMLIDAAHSEETRVVVIGPNGLEELDFESASLRTLKGNIYLAKVTRVEPSLQAAFVSYGGNRHGFLPFSEIHPDYYRIPVADREALLAETSDEREDRIDQDDDDGIDDGFDSANQTESADEDNAIELLSSESNEEDNNAEVAETSVNEPNEEDDVESIDANERAFDEVKDEFSEEDAEDDNAEGGRNYDRNRGRSRRRQQQRRRHPSNNRYKIQEVIKRGQIMLVQVGKEERGGKGAAMTTFISLAGRYCVLMPNTGNGGGISRKITDANDRKRLKSLIDDLDLPEGMATIVRTAGVERTKAELKRDHEVLLRLWDEIRERTLTSSAPALIYEEASLVKRAIRDLYGRDVDEVLVEGEGAYREAKDFMRSLMPSHAKRVQPYKDPVPLFQARGVEGRLEGLFNPIVRLPSGGYLVINQTEALVAIDVNSGRSTRERNIEETALKTNLEAAAEAARQLRLRELAGIVVIDFIDMDDRRNNAAVERKLKEAIKVDRARVHVGRMSPLGLVEISRQRLRPSMFETSFHECEVCAGIGRVRSVESNALGLLRAAEDCAFQAGGNVDIAVRAAAETIVYLLNHKRDGIQRIEEMYGARLLFTQDNSLAAHQRLVEVIGRNNNKTDNSQARNQDFDGHRHNNRDEEAEERPDRNRRPGRKRDDATNEREPKLAREDEEKSATSTPSNIKDDEDENTNRRRRRGRRGGRRRKGAEDEDVELINGEATIENANPITENADDVADSENEEQKGSRRRRRRRGGRGKSGADLSEIPTVADNLADNTATKTVVGETINQEQNRTSEPSSEDASETQTIAQTIVEPEPLEINSGSEPPPSKSMEEPEPQPSGPPRTGWWRRLRS